MTLQSYAGRDIETNDEGFMLDANQWSPNIGQAIANQIGLALTQRHWDVVNYAREDFADTSSSPGLRRVSKNTNTPIKELYQLFPKGPGKLIARIAGLPKPKSCL